MVIRAPPNSTSEPEDDADADTIPAMIAKLKMAFLPADYARAERTLLARESSLKREIKNLKHENAKLLEANQFQKLEMLRAETESEGVILEQRRRIKELERQKSKLEGLVVSEYEGWKSLVSRLEADAGILSGEKERSGGVEVKLEMEVEGDGIGGVAPSAASSACGGNGGVKDSGIRKFPSEDIGFIDRHNECAPMETEMPCVKSLIQKDTESLGLTGVVRVPKRKPASSLSGSDDDDKGGGKFKEDKNLNNEMKQRKKLSLEPNCPLIDNHCTEKLEFSGVKVSGNQNLPNHEQVNSRVSEGKIMADQKSQLSLNAVVELSSDSDSDSGTDASSSCSSSSSDSEDENLLLSQLDDILPKAEARKGR